MQSASHRLDASVRGRAVFLIRQLSCRGSYSNVRQARVCVASGSARLLAWSARPSVDEAAPEDVWRLRA